MHALSILPRIARVGLFVSELAGLHFSAASDPDPALWHSTSARVRAPWRVEARQRPSSDCARRTPPTVRVEREKGVRPAGGKKAHSNSSGQSIFLHRGGPCRVVSQEKS